jgi:hypothetical protein
MSSCNARSFSLILSRLLCVIKTSMSPRLPARKTSQRRKETTTKQARHDRTLSDRLCTSAARLLLAVAIFVGGLRAAGDSESSLSSRFRLLVLVVGSVVAPKQPFDRPDDDAAASCPPPPAARTRAAHRRRPGGVRRAAGDQHLVAPADAGPDRAQHRRRRRLMTRGLAPRADQLRQVVADPEADRLLRGPRHARRRRLGRRHQAAGGRLRHHRTVLVVVFRWWNDDARLTGRLDGGRRRCFAEQVGEDVERIGYREREPKARLVFWRRGRSRRWHARRRLLRPRWQLPVAGLALHDDMAVAPQQLHEFVFFSARNGLVSPSHKKN